MKIFLKKEEWYNVAIVTSQKWFQTPIKIQSSIKSDIDENVSKTQFEASDGRTYKFMGSQWAELLTKIWQNRFGGKKNDCSQN